MSLSTISRFNYTLISYLWLYRFICQVYAHPRPKVGLQVFAFIFYIPPPRVEDRYMMKSFITRARHPIRKTRFFVPPKFYSLRIVDSEFLKYKLFFSIMVFLIFLIYPFVTIIPRPIQTVSLNSQKNVFFDAKRPKSSFLNQP